MFEGRTVYVGPPQTRAYDDLVRVWQEGAAGEVEWRGGSSCPVAAENPNLELFHRCLRSPFIAPLVDDPGLERAGGVLPWDEKFPKPQFHWDFNHFLL